MSVSATELVAVVPVRGLPAGKRRLAALLDVDERNGLVLAMLDDVVGALAAAESVDRIAIASRDAAARDEAGRLGVDFLDQTELKLGYNRAVQFAQEALVDSDAILIVPADVPLITPDAVDLMVSTAPDGPAVVVAPAHDGGTNGLFLRPPDVVKPQFGPSSARAHQQSAAAAGRWVCRFARLGSTSGRLTWIRRLIFAGCRRLCLSCRRGLLRTRGGGWGLARRGLGLRFRRGGGRSRAGR